MCLLVSACSFRTYLQLFSVFFQSSVTMPRRKWPVGAIELAQRNAEEFEKLAMQIQSLSGAMRGAGKSISSNYLFLSSITIVSVPKLLFNTDAACVPFKIDRKGIIVSVKTLVFTGISSLETTGNLLAKSQILGGVNVKNELKFTPTTVSLPGNPWRVCCLCWRHWSLSSAFSVNREFCYT